MFSKLLSSARQIFTKPEDSEQSSSQKTLHQVLDSNGRRSPQKQRSPKKSASPRKQQVKSAYTVRKEQRDRETMVTTRRQSGALLLGSQSNSTATSENEINEDEIAYELLTQSAQKRRREKARDAGEETPSKRRKLPTREKTGTSPAVIIHSRLTVEIPVKDIASEGEPTPKATSDVAAKLVAAESPAATPTQQKKRSRPAKQAVLAEADDQLQKDVAAFEAQKAQKAVEEKVETPKVTKKAKAAAAKVEKVEKVVTPPIEAAKAETPAKPKHKKFGDDEPAAPIPLPSPIQMAVEDDESGSEDESSDDDDAPEEVGGKAAQEKAQASVAQAAKVAEQIEAAERQKRKEKEDKLKSQAQAAKKRKLVEEEKAKKEAEKEVEEESEDEDESMTLQEESSPVVEVRKEVTRETKKIKFDRNNLPDLLPEDFLEDEEMMDVDSEEEERPRQPKKIKFAQEEKAIKDVTLGHTTFRVQKKSKAGLAPKANKRAKMLKDALLGKRKGQVRKTPTGFFGAKRN